MRILLKAICAASLWFVSMQSQWALADATALFQNACSQCHSLAATDEVRVGPPLGSIVDQAAATAEHFIYSDGMRKAAAEGLVWDASSLDQFIKSPRAFISGTRMTYAGMADDADRQRLIEWLASAGKSDVDDQAIANPDVARIAALDADIDYGEYLASECVTCHVEGGSDGIPAIKGLSKNHFIEALLAYKNGEKINQVMQLMTGGMGDDEMAALATFFATDN